MIVPGNNESSAILASLLAEYGIKDIVICPGSRNVPLISQLVNNGVFALHHIVDERAAAFFALGLTQISQKATAVICTSGSAILDTAPAVAEAYYKKLPLLIISADRPSVWIDQEDSQTIRQDNVLAQIVKQSFNLLEIHDSESRWYVTRLINDALLAATGVPQGPVHINVPISDPSCVFSDIESVVNTSKISVAPTIPTINKEYLRVLAAIIQSTRRIMIFVGSNQPSSKLTKALDTIGRFDNVVIIGENLANLHCKYALEDPDLLFSNADNECGSEMIPEILITFGGAPVSKAFKNWIRCHASIIEHWHISTETRIIDTYGCLKRKFVMCAEDFFLQIRTAIRHSDPMAHSDFRTTWKHYHDRLLIQRDMFLAKNPSWNDITAIRKICEIIPHNWNLQVSNGLAVRYLMSVPITYRCHRIDCNRGVSGIDGSTSTAVGAAKAYNGTTVLFSGDMSAIYDMAGLINSVENTENFKIVILDNKGGQIFRYIGAADEHVRNAFLCKVPSLDWRKCAESLGLHYSEASDFEELDAVMPDWKNHRKNPSLLVIHTSDSSDSSYFKNYICLKNTVD